MDEFIVNDFLSLRLEGGKTNIYINGKRFNQCKFLMLDIPIEETARFDEIDSIDEVADILGWKDRGQEGVKYEIDPETEFWGHCSNLQAWYENDYDTRLLHRSIAFSLLKKLSEVGDPLAKKVFADEIAKRFESEYPNVIVFILTTGLLKILNNEERGVLIEQNIPIILTAIENLTVSAKPKAFVHLVDTIRNTVVTSKTLSQIEAKFLIILESIDKVDESINLEVFSNLLKIAIETEWIEKYFSTFLEVIDILPSYQKSKAFVHLVDAIKNTDLMSKHLSQIEAEFLIILESLDKLAGSLNHDAFSNLLKIAIDTSWIEKYFSSFLDCLATTSLSTFISFKKYSEFSDLLEAAKEKGWIERYFNSFLDVIEIFSIPYKLEAICSLIYAIKGTKLLNEKYSQIETVFLAIVESKNEFIFYETEEEEESFFNLLKIAEEIGWIDKHFSVLLENLNLSSNLEFSALLEVADQKGWVEEYLYDFLELIQKISISSRFRAFSEIFYAARNKYYSQSETIFLTILESINQYEDEDRVVPTLLDMAKELGWKDEYLYAFIQNIDKLFGEIKYDLFKGLLEKLKGTKLLENNFHLFLEIIDNLSTKIKYDYFNSMLRELKRTKLLEKKFLFILEIVNERFGKDKYRAFNQLITSIKNTEIMTTYFSQIETYFHSLAGSIDRLPDKEKYIAIYSLSNSIRETELFENFISQNETLIFTLLNGIDKLCACDDYDCDNYHMSDAYSSLIATIRDTELMRKYFSAFLDILSKIKGRRLPYYPFLELLRVAEEMGLLEKHFHDFLKTLNNLPDDARYRSFSELLNVAKKDGKIESRFHEFLKIVDNLPNKEKSRALSDLIDSIKGTLSMSKLYPYLEECFLNFLEIIHKNTDTFFDLIKILEETGLKKDFIPTLLDFTFKLPPDWSKDNNFSAILNLVKGTGTISENLHSILENLERLNDWDRINVFSDLIKVLSENGLMEEFFATIMETVVKLDDVAKYSVYSKLINLIKETELINNYNSQIKAHFLVLLKNMDELHDKDKFQALNYLFRIAIEIGWIEEHFSSLLEYYKTFAGLYQYNSFSKLINFFIETKLFKKFKSQIGEQFLILLENLEELPVNDKSSAFYTLFEVARKTGWLEEYFSEFLKQDSWFYDLISTLKAYDKNYYLLLDKHYSQIEPLFLAKLNRTDYLFDNHGYPLLSYLLDLFKNTKLVKNYYSQIEAKIPILLDNIDTLHGYNQYSGFLDLLGRTREMGWIEKYFLNFLKALDKLQNEGTEYKYNAFNALLKSVKSTKLMSKYYSQIALQFFSLLNSIEKLCDCNNVGGEECYEYHQQDAFYNLRDVIKDTELENDPAFKKWKKLQSENALKKWEEHKSKY